MIVVVGGIKGGTGKTTLCTNLVVERSTSKKVLMVDADEQEVASEWLLQRENSEIPIKWNTMQMLGDDVGEKLKKLKKNYDEIFVDVGGRDTDAQRSVLIAADIFITPFQPRSADLWTIRKLKKMLLQVLSVNPKLRLLSVLNKADSQGSDNKDTEKILQKHEIFEVVPFYIQDRKAFANAFSEGLGVKELKRPNLKATSEFNSFCDYVFSSGKKVKKTIKKT